MMKYGSMKAPEGNESSFTDPCQQTFTISIVVTFNTKFQKGPKIISTHYNKNSPDKQLTSSDSLTENMAVF